MDPPNKYALAVGGSLVAGLVGTAIAFALPPATAKDLGSLFLQTVVSGAIGFGGAWIGARIQANATREATASALHGQRILAADADARAWRRTAVEGALESSRWRVAQLIRANARLLAGNRQGARTLMDEIGMRAATPFSMAELERAVSGPTLEAFNTAEGAATRLLLAALNDRSTPDDDDVDEREHALIALMGHHGELEAAIERYVRGET